MRVAFALDDTLIPCARPFASGVMARGLSARLAASEPLRQGTAELLAWLRKQGSEAWVYPSSGRAVLSVHLLFATYGLRVDGVIHDRIHHERAVRSESGAAWPVKFPPAFGIDVLVDDAEAVRLAGLRHRFAVIQVLPEDEDWTGTVRRQLG